MAGFDNPHYGEREAWATQVAQNSAKTAWAWGEATSHGQGEFLIEDPIMFGITFRYRPNVAHGFALLDDDQLVPFRYPRAGGGVSSWIQDADENYIGAHVFVTVGTADATMVALAALLEATGGHWDGSESAPFGVFRSDPGYDILHSFTFVGLAFKDVR